MTLKERIGRLGMRLAGYDAGDSSRMRKDLGWGRATPRDEDNLTNDGTQENVRQRAADLRRNNPIVAGLCDRLASWTVGTGIIPQSKTKSREWNQMAEDYWTQWSKIADSRGRCSLWQMQWQAVSLRPTHGGLYFELLENGQIRPIECERIRQPQDAERAKQFVNGVHVDRDTGIILGYMVHSRTASGGFDGKHAERYVAAENMVPVIRPTWRPDQIREMPDLAAVLPALQDIHELGQNTVNTSKVQSMIIGYNKKLAGAGSNSLPRGSTTPTVGQRQTFKTEWGQIMEGFPGEDLEFKSSATPNPQYVQFVKLHLMLAASALDVPYEWLTLDFSSADFSRQKAIMQLVNKALRNWRQWLNESMNTRLWNWRIAKAIKAGELPPAPTVTNAAGFEVSQWFRVEWQSPEEVSTDRQESNQADMLEWQMGLGPLSAAAKRRGGDLEERLRSKAEDLTLADSIEREYGLPAGTLIKVQIPGQTENVPAGRPPEDEDTDDGND